MYRRTAASVIAATAVAACLLGLPCLAHAQQVGSAAAQSATPSVAVTRSVSATDAYDLSFTLPTAGKSGCMVCHGDKNLVRLKGEQFVSYWVDGSILDISAHATIQCTGCHLDFAYKAPHGLTEEEWQRTAKLACKNCHQDQFQSFGQGVHTISSAPGEKPDPKAAEKPLCGDCHGGHDIAVLTDNPAGQERMHRAGWEACGRCHEDYWNNHDDYYHGDAYRNGAPDAPACWDCHGAHDIHRSDDRRSQVSENRLEETCQQCHPSANERYVEYSGLIHAKREVLEQNPLYSWYQQARKSVTGFFDSVASLFG